MCKLTHPLKQKEFTGYKVACRKNGRYYSPAIGVRYPKKGKVPIARKQERLAEFFISNILDHRDRFSPFRPLMTGRTSVFYKISDAIALFRNIRFYQGSDDEGKLRKSLRVIKVKLTDDLFRGHYGSCNVVAGKHMEILEEVKMTVGLN